LYLSNHFEGDGEWWIRSNLRFRLEGESYLKYVVFVLTQNPKISNPKKTPKTKSKKTKNFEFGNLDFLGILSFGLMKLIYNIKILKFFKRKTEKRN